MRDKAALRTAPLSNTDELFTGGGW